MQSEVKEAGQPFNPWHGVCGFYPPDVVARQWELTDGQKRLYERLVRWAGQNGTCWYAFETMADELGKSERQVRRDACVLEKHGLVRHTRRGNRLSNTYEFLWNPIFEGAQSERTPMSDHHESDGTPMSTHSPSERTSTVGVNGHPRSSDRTPVSTEFSNELRKENCVRDTHTVSDGTPTSYHPESDAEKPFVVPLPKAADLDGQVSQRFAEFWEAYPRKQHKDAACAQWVSVVTVENEAAVFACLQRYLASDEVSRHVVMNPEKWLFEQNLGGWTGDWPRHESLWDRLDRAPGKSRWDNA